MPPLYNLPTAPLLANLRQRDRRASTLLFLTTNPGIEDVTALEFCELAQAQGWADIRVEVTPFERPGHVLAQATAPPAELTALALQMHSVHHVSRPYYCFTLPPAPANESPLAHLREKMTSLPVPEMETAASFRVTTERSGEHPFGSMDVQREAGAALQAHYGTPVDLTAYGVNVRVDVFDADCLVSVQETRETLTNRFVRLNPQRATLRANVAYALLRLAEITPHTETLLDPFCGSGTILYEAATAFPHLNVLGSDRSAKALQGSQANLSAAGLAERVSLRAQDARRLRRVHEPSSVDVVVCNPPYGKRLGHQSDFGNLYQRFLAECAIIMKPGGRLVLLVLKRGAFNKAVEGQDAFTIRHVRLIETGRVYPAVFVLGKRTPTR